MYYSILEQDYGHHSDHTIEMKVLIDDNQSKDALHRLLTLLFTQFPTINVRDGQNHSYFAVRPPWWADRFRKSTKEIINQRFVYWTGKPYFDEILSDDSSDSD